MLERPKPKPPKPHIPNKLKPFNLQLCFGVLPEDFFEGPPWPIAVYLLQGSCAGTITEHGEPLLLLVNDNLPKCRCNGLVNLFALLFRRPSGTLVRASLLEAYIHIIGFTRTRNLARFRVQIGCLLFGESSTYLLCPTPIHSRCALDSSIGS